MTYGLGAEAESLPAYVVMPDARGAQEAGVPMYTHGFLPAVYQPAMFRPGKKPVLNLDLPGDVSPDLRRKTIDLIRGLNEDNLIGEDAEFAARISAYDTAFKMQTEAPEIFDISKESKETLDLYGVGDPKTDDYGRRCLLARRMVENGVRFVCVVSGGGSGDQEWDAHNDIEENHIRMAGQTDKPVAALITDLKRRGLLDSTIVLWGGEFGRSPESERIKGRDHHALGFTMYLAGGGFKGGTVYGATDDIGLQAVENPVHFRDLHATMLNQLGLQQDQLSYIHLGRRERLTEVHGRIIKEIPDVTEAGWRDLYRMRYLLLVGLVFSSAACRQDLRPDPGTSAKQSDAAPVTRQRTESPLSPRAMAGSYADVVDRAAPAVVTIRSARRARAPKQFPFLDDPFFRRFFGDRERQGSGRSPESVQQGIGSGVLVRGDGYILTNHHVIDGADEIRIDLRDHRTFSAKLVGSDPPSDIAVLR